jgi:hypothetical protein
MEKTWCLIKLDFRSFTVGKSFEIIGKYRNDEIPELENLHPGMKGMIKSYTGKYHFDYDNNGYFIFRIKPDSQIYTNETIKPYLIEDENERETRAEKYEEDPDFYYSDKFAYFERYYENINRGNNYNINIAMMNYQYNLSLDFINNIFKKNDLIVLFEKERYILIYY